MTNILAYKIRNRLLRYKPLRKPIITLEEHAHRLAFYLNIGARKKLAGEYSSCSDFDSLFQFACQNLGPHQKRIEITQLLRFVSERQPKTALEIGMAQAGTTFLLKENLRSLTMLIGIDIHLHNLFVLKTFNKRNCDLHFFEGDSKDVVTKKNVVEALGGRKLDLLFIDGDHSYEGVKSDFEKYAPLVASGGMIVFHDICEDYQTRYGRHTGNYTGGVPQFWKEIRQGFEFHEFVDDYDQDGFGIGCLIYKDRT